MSFRFRDYQTRLFDFEHDVLVKCPQCDRCARSLYLADQVVWQITCVHCGYAKKTQGKVKQYGTAVDPIFGLPLWLQIPCCGEILWAYNSAHLEFLEQYIQATLRERQDSRGQHLSIATRLPRWMKIAKNRRIILKDIQHLKDRCS